MPKKFLVNVAILLAANLLIKPFWIFGVDLTVQNSLGNAVYGEYIHLFAISLFFTMVLDFGMNNYTTSHVAKFPHLISQNLGLVLPFKLVLSVLYVVITLAFGYLNQITTQGLLMLLVLALNQVLAYFTLLFRANIAGLQWFKTDALLSITDRFAMIAFALLLMAWQANAVSVWDFILIQSFGFFIAFILSGILVFKQTGKPMFTFNVNFIQDIFLKSWPYALLVLLMTLYMRLDYLLIKKLLPNGNTENGIYALANRLFEAANMFAVLISGMLLPLFAKLLQQKQQLENLIKTALVLLLIPAAMVAAVSWFYAPQILILIKNEGAAQSAQVFKWVMLAFFFLCVMYVFGTLLTAGAKLLVLNKLAAIALLINIALNIFLIPLWGAKGAAITAVVTHGFIAITNTWQALVIFKINHLFHFMLKLMGVILAIFVAAWLSIWLNFSLIMVILLVMGTAVLFTFFLRLLQVNMVVNLLKQKHLP